MRQDPKLSFDASKTKLLDQLGVSGATQSPDSKPNPPLKKKRCNQEIKLLERIIKICKYAVLDR
jgi:hypothetical protein